jgi:putative transposase
MPRRARQFIDGLPYHVLNRGNRRQGIFSQQSDYEMFLSTIADAIAKVPMRIPAYAIMPNHFHFVLWPEQGPAISAFMRWLMNAHIRRHHRRRELWGTGHLYQGRYKAFPIQRDNHLLTVFRYVEANALRARLVQRAEDWHWSSLTRTTALDGRPIVGASPICRPDNWRDLVNEQLSSATCNALKASAQREIPFGDPEWVRAISVNGDSHR